MLEYDDGWFKWQQDYYYGKINIHGKMAIQYSYLKQVHHEEK